MDSDVLNGGAVQSYTAPGESMDGSDVPGTELDLHLKRLPSPFMTEDESVRGNAIFPQHCQRYL